MPKNGLNTLFLNAFCCPNWTGTLAFSVGTLGTLCPMRFAPRVAATAPASGAARWQSWASGARSKAIRRCPGQGLGLLAVRVAGGGVQADCRQVGLLPVSLAPLHRRQFAGPSFSRSLKAAVGKRRRQCRAVPGGDRRQAGQDGGEAAHRLPIGVAVAWSWGRLAGRHRLQTCARVAAGVARAGGAPSSAVRRAFVLSIAQGCRGATTAPVSSSAWW
jgi:hypothetical protein